MNAISEIKEELKKYPSLKFIVEDNTISITPENGFTVWLTEYENQWTVGYKGWHEEFEDQESALKCLFFGLSSTCRLKVFKRGNMEYKWTMEAEENGQWVSYSTTCLLFIPFWRRRSIIYLSNNVMST